MKLLFNLKLKEFSKYFWTVISILLTASTFFSADQKWLVFFFLLTVIILIKQKKLYWSKEIKLVLFFLTIITLLQTIFFSFFSFWTNAGTFIRFILPWFLLLLIGKEYLRYFVRIMYLFTIINFIFFIPSLLIPGFFESISELPHILGLSSYGEGTTTILYTIETGVRNSIRQNSGPFFEPGQYASYLVMALIFNLYIHKSIFIKQNLLFIAALIFTQSTAGYLFFFLLLSFYLIIGAKRKILGYVSFTIIFIISLNFYRKVDFLEGKIDKQYSNMIIESRYGYGNGSDRTTTTYNDFYASLKSPIIGLGRNDKTRYGSEVNTLTKFIKSNTTFDIAASFGYPFFLLYFYLIYFTFKQMNKHYKLNNKYAVFFTFIIAIMYIPQTLYLHIPFVILLYLNIFYKSNINDFNLNYHPNIQQGKLLKSNTI